MALGRERDPCDARKRSYQPVSVNCADSADEAVARLDLTCLNQLDDEPALAQRVDALQQDAPELAELITTERMASAVLFMARFYDKKV